MRLGFVTCVELGISCIEALYRKGAALDVVLTLKDNIAVKKSGRVFLDQFCEENSIPLHKVQNINDQLSLKAIKNADLDWLFIIGWSQIAGRDVLCSTRNGVIGMHPTLLPEGRGRASIPWAILKKKTKTGVTAFKMDSGVDTGPILVQKEVALKEFEDATSLYSSINSAHVEVMEYVVEKVLSNTLVMVPQDEAVATVWSGRSPKDGELTLGSSVEEAELLVRACTKPYPGAFLWVDGKRKLTIWKADRVDSVEDGELVIPFVGGCLRCLSYSCSS